MRGEVNCPSYIIAIYDMTYRCTVRIYRLLGRWIWLLGLLLIIKWSNLVGPAQIRLKNALIYCTNINFLY